MNLFDSMTDNLESSYILDIYFSADGFPVRSFIAGVTFGTAQMDKKQIDAEMDRWVEQIVSEDTFPGYVEDYLRKEKMWEDAQSNE